MTDQMEFSMKREKAACRCIEWQECLRCAEEDGDKELICYCRQKVEKYLAKIKKMTLAPDYKSNCKSKPVVKPVRRRTFLERKQIQEIEK